MKISVLHLITELSIGGAQMVLLRLLANLDREHFTVTVACLYNGDGAVAQQIRDLGIPVVDLGMKRKWRLDAFFRLWRLLRRVRPQVLHTWMFHANLPGRLIGRLAGIPVIIGSEHTMGQESRRRLLLNRLTAGLVDKVICVSPQVADFARRHIGLPESKLATIANGVEVERFALSLTQAEARQRFQLPVEGVVVGAVGRPRPVKGYRYLIDAFQLCRPTQFPLYLVFVGNGPERPALIEQVQRAGLTERVFFLDDQQEIPAVMAALDLLVLPSLWEGMPMVALEAMAAGLPVIATAVGGTPDVVIHNETGLLVPPADPSALAAAIQTLVQAAECRHTLGEAGRRRACTLFSIQQNVAQTEILYKELLLHKQGTKREDDAH
ncbi:MAG: glycosyltransferase [Caldilineaceae bacterium]